MKKVYALFTITFLLTACTQSEPDPYDTQKENSSESIVKLEEMPSGPTVYTNEDYDFSFVYPAELELTAGDAFGLAETEEGVEVLLSSKDYFTMLVLMPDLFDAASSYGEDYSNIANIQRMEPKEYTEFIRDTNLSDDNPNITDKYIGEIEETSINGHTAYKLEMDKTYVSERGSSLLNAKFTFYYVKPANYLIEIKFPSNNSEAQAILDTLRFTPAQDKTALNGWTLVSGGAPNWESASYEGPVQLTGSLVMKPFYIGETVAHFHVSDTGSLPKFIADKGRDLYLRVPGENDSNVDPSEEFLAQLESLGEDSTVTVLADKLGVGMEGSAWVRIFEIID